VNIYRHISAERADCTPPVSLMCELLGVSVPGYRARGQAAAVKARDVI
jgi:hypothetical protein